MTEHYIQAFKQFSNADESEFQYLVKDLGVYFLWKERTYIVKREEDLLDQYRYIFQEDEHYDDIALLVDSDLWTLLTETKDFEYNQVATSIYSHWKTYWNKKRDKFKTEEKYDRFKDESWQDLQFLIQLTRGEVTALPGAAESINTTTLVPLVALAIRDQYDDLEEFLDDCIDVLTENGQSLLTMDDTFEMIGVELGEEEVVLFYIYNDLMEFDFLLSESEL